MAKVKNKTATNTSSMINIAALSNDATLSSLKIPNATKYRFVFALSNDDIITNILLVLKKLGLIEYHLAAKKQENSSFDNIKTIYQIDAIRKQI